MLDKNEIEEQLYHVMDNADFIRGRLRGMSYADGIIDALEWVLENSDEPPFRKEDYEGE